MPELNIEEWRRTLESLASPEFDTDAMRIEDLCQQLQWGDRRVRRYVREGLKTGMVETVPIRVLGIDGRYQMRIGYRLVKTQEETK